MLDWTLFLFSTLVLYLFAVTIVVFMCYRQARLYLLSLFVGQRESDLSAREQALAERARRT